MPPLPNLTPTIADYQPSDLVQLEAMYATFQPLGAANGLPPVRADQRRQWLVHLGSKGDSLVARTGAAMVGGHAALAKSGEEEAEVAVFVHQEWRGLGIGTALTEAAVERARARGYRRIWAAVLLDNDTAIRMVRRCGFRRVPSTGGGEVEMELLLA